MIRHCYPFQTHAVFGKRAGFIGTDDVGGTQRFHSGEPIHQGIALTCATFPCQCQSGDDG